MQTDNNIALELERRIHADAERFHGHLPERYALTWHGYIAGLYEWGVIDISAYKRLVKILPQTSEPDPVLTVFSGRT